jgi:hypothetical protein
VDGSPTGRGPRNAEVARGGIEVAELAVGLAAAKMRQRGVRAQRDGATIGLDRAKRLGVSQGGVTAAQQRAIVPLPVGGLVGQRTADAGEGQE